MRMALVTTMFALAIAGCGGSDDGDGGDSAADSGDDGGTVGTSDPSAGDDGSTGQGGTGSGDDGPFSGDCNANVPFAIADDLDLTAMSADAERQEGEEGTVPLYIVQIHGTDAGANRLDILFRGDPVLDNEYMPSSPPGAGPGPSFVGLYPSTETAHDFVSGTLQFSEAGTADGEILAASFDFEFEGGTVAGCFALPITVTFSAPP